MTKKDLEKTNFDLRQLLEISKSLNSTLDFNILIESILYTVMGQMRVLNIALFIKDQVDHDHFSLHRDYKGFELDHSYHYTIPLNSSLVHHLQKNTRTFTVKEMSKALKDSPEMEMLMSLNPTMIVPLKSKGYINGLILLGESVEGEELSRPQREYLLNISQFAAIAINNASLYEMASTDMMTKLKMRHFFGSALEDTFENAMRSGKTLSVIILDIDHFKKLNDTWGHTCGDHMLMKVADIIRGSVRRMDTAARYGGEEFVILLPGAGLDVSRGVGERIRSQVENLRMDYDGNDISCTISIGIAVLNTRKDFAAQNIIKRADIALYQSKENGRNRVTVAD